MKEPSRDNHDGDAHSPDCVIIRADRSLLSFGLSDLWRYRDLLFFLVWRDLKVRYKQTLLGVLWAILQPVLTMLVFTFVFNRLAGIQANGIPYPLFSLAGLLPWFFFSQGLTQSSNSLVGSSHLITKVFFPRIFMPVAPVLAGCLDLILAMIVLAGLMTYFGILPGWSFLALPVVIGILLLSTLGVGIWLSAVNVRYRDVRYVVPFLTQLWMFVSPVIYPASDVISKFESRGLPIWLYGLNPMVGVVESYRWAVLGVGSMPGSLLIASAGMSLVLFISGLVYFRSTERDFADIV